MAENASSSSAASQKTADGAKAPPKGNPAFRALGLPNWRFRLPSRNWLIFLSITTSWTAALIYDRRQKRKVQEKWCNLVSHIRYESLPPASMGRRVTIFLSAPPGDSVRSAREHFVEYVKPILVAAAVDWDVIEEKFDREGEIRAGLAERIRRQRRKAGEAYETSIERDRLQALDECRQRTGVQEWPDVQGDLVIGRHTWKEYVRGLHEGWLGPLDEPKELPPIREVQGQDKQSSTEKPEDDIPATPEPELMTSPEAEPLPSAAEEADASAQGSKSENKEVKESQQHEDAKKEAPKKPPFPPAYISPSSYSQSSLPASIPHEFQPSSPIRFPHLLGFLNTPTRMYRFLTRRHLADDVGRHTAAVVLATYRPYNQPSDTFSTDSAAQSISTMDSGSQWEQQQVLEHEEENWTKSARKRKPDDTRERVWLDNIVIDPRIGERMRRFEVSREDEERAQRIADGAAGIPGYREEPNSEYEG